MTVYCPICGKPPQAIIGSIATSRRHRFLCSGCCVWDETEETARLRYLLPRLTKRDEYQGFTIREGESLVDALRRAHAALEALKRTQRELEGARRGE